jgi:hypothetical protein
MSDTHSIGQGQAISEDLAFRPPFPKADVLLHTGDLTNLGRPEENQAAFDFLKAIDVELKLVIAGNHDLTLDKDFYLNAKVDRFRDNKSDALQARRLDPKSYDAKNADIVYDLWTSDEAKAAGIHYLEEGIHNFSLSNGAQFSVYATPWQPEFCNWAFNYAHHEDRYNPPELISKEPYIKDPKKSVVSPTGPFNPIPKDAEVDIFLTHGPPWTHLDRCDGDGYLAGCPHLLSALNRVRPRLHCFGHIHEACEYTSPAEVFPYTESLRGR